MEKKKNRAEKKKDSSIFINEYSKAMYLYALSFFGLGGRSGGCDSGSVYQFLERQYVSKIQNEVTKTYLFRFGKNNCLNRLKKKDVLRDRLDLFREDVAEEEMMMWNDTLIQEVGTAIEEMPEQTREIYSRCIFSGDEISGGSRLSGYIYKYS